MAGTAHGIKHTRPIVANGRHFNAANDSEPLTAGIAAPPVEMDQPFFERADLAYAREKDSGLLQERRLWQAHLAEVQRASCGEMP